MSSTYEELCVRYGFDPGAPIDATHLLPVVRPAAAPPESDVERTGPIYPDPGPDLAAVRHTRWPDDAPLPEHIPTTAVYEQGGAILRRLDVLGSQLAVIQRQLDRLLTERTSP